MEPRHPRFCGPYQQARQVKGVPMCGYTRHACPFGRHACSLCGKNGHGAEDCRLTAAPPSVVPPPQQPQGLHLQRHPRVLLQPCPSPDHRSPRVRLSLCLVSVARVKERQQSMGLPLPLQVCFLQPTSPLLLSSPAVLQGCTGASPPSDPLIPSPIPATTEEVEEWVSSSFRPLTNISTTTPLEVGASVLWRGVKTGKSGNPSTKCEYFNGKVRDMRVEEDNELYLYVD